jgi:outer membrane lipoprotein SlyB
MKKLFALLLISLIAIGAPLTAFAYCDNCGRVQNIEQYTGHRNTTAGTVAGALIGGAIGNQVGGGDGKKLATVGGAVAGGYAGHEIAENSGKTKYRVTVRMDNGGMKTVSQNSLHGIHVGSYVRVRHGTAVRA